ncbi:phage antirepressor N-terminal domain-containing protein [Lichenibacterium dinghuense]|nr:phage antirepressor N-terminal domain-containing protein [Lichenibacterium sp. 6Y81]
MGSTINVDFHGDPLAAILDEDRILVPLRPLVVGMGLD